MTRPELLVLAGLRTSGVEAVITRIRALDPTVAVLHHDLRDVCSGLVHRRLRVGDTDESTELELVHGCLSCTVREDLLRVLAGPARRIVLHLDPALEPEYVCWSLLHVTDGATIADAADLLGVVTCVDSGNWLADTTGDDGLAERGLSGLPDDERTVAQVAVGQAEFADLLVHTGTADAWTLARTEAVLTRLVPAAPRLRLADLDERVFLTGAIRPARRGRPDDVHAPLLRGHPPLTRDCGVQLLLFSARRPFHPERLHKAMDVLLDGVVRTRGRIWIATRPEAVLWLESAGGGLHLGYAGEWLAGADAHAWEQAPPERTALASLAWDPQFGDRAQDVVAITYDADHEEIAAVLNEALLTDAELAAGEQGWRALPDPFAWWDTAAGAPACPAPIELIASSAHGEKEES